MRFWKVSACLLLGVAVFFFSTESAFARMRLFIRPWWPMPVIVAPILPPVVRVPPPPSQETRPNFGSVDTNVTPRDAQVIVDGELRGIANAFDGAPAYLELPPGRHKIEFKKSGFEPVSLIVSVGPGEVVGVDLALRELGEATGPAEGNTYQLETESAGFIELDVTPPDAAVYIDDAFYGTASQFLEAGQKIMLRAGSHTVEIGRPGYNLYRGNVTIPEKQTIKLEVSLEK